MNRNLLWKLILTVAAGAVLLFAAIDWLTEKTEYRMSVIVAEHRQQLTDYARHAELLLEQGDEEALAAWLEEIQQREDTWAAVVRSQVIPMAGSTLHPQFTEGFSLGRSIEWKIHLYFSFNPIMDLTFSDGQTHFLIRLPQRMRPGENWDVTRHLLQLVLPLMILALLCLMLYRHLMEPIRQLEVATRNFASGDYDARVRDTLGKRNDELAALATTFDRMAERTGSLIRTQRQLLADLSHELRTPLTRIEMSLDCEEQGVSSAPVLPRIRREAAQIRELAEDSLTLAWLETEQPELLTEPVELTDLLDAIVSDASFEFPDRQIACHYPDRALLQSSQRALAQAIENILRNAMRYTPAGKSVAVTLIRHDDHYLLIIRDQGPGVPEEELELIFQPFYRVEKARGEASGGFGLGLALAQRQLQAVGGSVKAENLPGFGLEMLIILPL